jgi:pyruvate,water dikinase
VLGTAVATRRLRSGQRIVVDGDAGTVTILDGGGRTVDEKTPAGSSSSHTAAATTD